MKFVTCIALVFSSLQAQADLKKVTPPSVAPDGTAVVRLLPLAEFKKLSSPQAADYLQKVRVAIVHYEETMGKHFSDTDFALRAPNTLKLWQLLVGDFAQAEEARTTYFRCLYAGWSVTGKKCVPKKTTDYTVLFTVKTTGQFAKMDDDIKITLSCPAGEILCNPVIFGVTEPSLDDLGGPYEQKSIRPPSAELADLVKSKVKPVCITSKDKRNSSRECYYRARELKAVANPKYNPEMYAEFQAGFDQMCGPSGVSHNPYFKDRPRAILDMKDTCAWIQRQLDNQLIQGSRRNSYSPEREFTPADQKGNEATP